LQALGVVRCPAKSSFRALFRAGRITGMMIMVMLF